MVLSKKPFLDCVIDEIVRYTFENGYTGKRYQITKFAYRE